MGAFAVGIIIFVGLINFISLVPPVVNWDEGTHALWGFKVWMALRSGDFQLFWQLSRDQFAYPPLGSWLIALTNLPVEFSMNLARFTSTLGFIVGGILTFLIARILASPLPSPNRRGNTKGEVFSLFLFLTSPAILFYSVAVFKESWGMALTLLTIYLYFRAVTQKTAIAYFCVSLSLILLFWEKYNYALLLGLVLGLEGMVEFVLLMAGPAKHTLMSSLRAPTVRRGVAISANWFLRLLRRFTPRNDKKYSWFLFKQLALFLPLLIFASWWILTPTNKLSWFLDIMRSDWNPVTVEAGNSWQYLTFFVQSIRVSYVFSDVLFGLVAIGYLWAIRDLWQKKVRVLFLFFTLNFVLGTLHSINLQDRYILTSVPALFLLAGYEWQSLLAGPVGRLLDRSFLRRQTPSTPLGTDSSKTCQVHRLPPAYVLFILLILLDLRNFPVLLKSNATHMLLSPMYNESDYKDTLFDFNKNSWPRQSSTKSESSEGVINYILENVDVNKPIEIIGWTAEISPDWWELRRQLVLRKSRGNWGNQGNYLVTIEVKPTSRLYTYDYRRANLWQLNKVREVEQNNKDELLQQKDFKELGVLVKIYTWKN